MPPGDSGAGEGVNEALRGLCEVRLTFRGSGGRDQVDVMESLTFCEIWIHGGFEGREV